MAAVADIPTTDALMTPMQFSAEDITANRQGTLGSQQRARFEHLQRRILIVGAGGFVSLALLATIFLFLGQMNDALVLSVVGAGDPDGALTANRA